ncbi:LysR family transcriptional regulator [Methylobacterium terrae]|uniref:LysR family transcriptional regulator n=1 Tax=Methylobacterium terrae TaxID=2202827 RepID=A0A2U8WUN0_9HYPH|nr:LysR family transcriptional regulator [Methylobacterium terrae]AWN49769.1 LysR family transcriptional regulator [Methylobacterium terrae]
MSLRALRTLQAIVRHGSFARAGEAIGLTQSAVSLQVKALEEEFAVQLFDRSHRRPALTEAGKIVLAKAEEVLALYDQIPEALSDERSLVGRLKVGAMPSVLSGLLPDALVALYRAHPRIRVHVAYGLSGELAHQIAAGELDVAVTLEPTRPHPANLFWTPLYEDRFWLIAPAELGRQDPRKLLAEQPFIRLDSRAWSGRPIDHELRRLRVSVREEMVLGSPETIIKMVQKGLGISIISMSDELRAELPIICLPFGEPQLTRRIGLLERQNRSGGRLVAALAKAIAEATRQHVD